MSNKILLVEDDTDILKINTIHLTNEGYDVVAADNLNAAYGAVLEHSPDLIVLDVNLPDGSGFSFCEKIRKETSVPIIFLTCYDEETDKVKGLMAGGDDYLTKPYGLSELSARVHALLRRANMGGTKIIEYLPITVDTLAERAFYNGKDAGLSHKEYQLFLYLIKNNGKPLDAIEIYEKLWGLPSVNSVKTVSVHISSLRKKLKMDYDKKAQIKTVRNVGYSFVYEKDS